MIYLDNAATSYQKPEAVYQAVQEAMYHMGNSGRGAHGASLDASRQIYSARELLAAVPCGRPIPGGVYGQFHRKPEYGSLRPVRTGRSRNHHNAGT